jgi:hypothetical protein
MSAAMYMHAVTAMCNAYTCLEADYDAIAAESHKWRNEAERLERALDAAIKKAAQLEMRMAECIAPNAQSPN